MRVMEVDLTGVSPSQGSKPVRARKRKVDAISEGVSTSRSGGSLSNVIDLTGETDGTIEGFYKAGARKKKPRKKERDSEKRLKRHRAQPPASYSAIYERATTQRMYVLDRVRGGTLECPEETIKIAGSTGNVYTVVIGQVPTCDCPHAKKGNQCKHVVFVLARVLRAPAPLQYQLALLKSELRDIFVQASPIVAVDASEPEVDGNRKAIGCDDNCPICFMEFETGFTGTVYCKASCGNNIHKECMDQWAASRRRSSAPVTCPFCRTNWSAADEGITKQVAATGGTVNEEGYVNVASELGLSGRRDFSTYHSFWVRGQARAGVDVGEWYDDF